MAEHQKRGAKLRAMERDEREDPDWLRDISLDELLERCETEEARLLEHLNQALTHRDQP